MNQLSMITARKVADGTGPRILIVDDDPDSGEITARLLASGGTYDITCVESAEDAYAALSITGPQPKDVRMAYDLVIMDILMPKVDGIEATAAIRTTHKGAFVPILMLSGRRDLDAMGQAFMAGASDFVTKPIEAVELQARVRTLLRLKREHERRLARERQLVASNRELQQAVIDGTLIDKVTGLPSRSWAELVLRDCRENARPVAAALVQIEELDAYVAHAGVREAERLYAQIAARLLTVPAPMGASLTAWDEGRFLILTPGLRDTALLARTCESLQRAVEYPAIIHGNALHHDRVRISTACGWRRASQSVELPAALIASLGDASFRGKRHIDLPAET